MTLCLPDGPVIIDGVCKFRTNIRISNCDCILFQYIGCFQSIDPVHPVLSAHNLYCTFQFSLFCRLYCFGNNGIGAQIQAFLSKRLISSLQRRYPHFALSICSSGCCQAVNDHVYLSKVFLYHRNSLSLYFL